MRWIEACKAGHAPKISLKATHTSVLEFVDLDLLMDYDLDEA
jgi:hypothetical protein